MTSMDMLKGLSFLDDQLVDKALRTKKSDKSHIAGWNVIAACFGATVLVCFLAVQFGKLLGGSANDVPIQMESEPYGSPDPAAGTPGHNDAAADEIIATPAPEADDVEEIRLPIITSYGDVEIDASYAAPKNGELGYSEPLKEAMSEYENGVTYKVFIDLFSDEFPVLSNSSEAREEVERLAEAGYTAELDITDDGTDVFYYFVLLASYEQLHSFDASREYGYMFFLYDERVGYVDYQTIIEASDRIPQNEAGSSQQSESWSYEEPDPINGGEDSEEQIYTAVEEGEPEYIVIVCHDVGEPDFADSVTDDGNAEGCFLDLNDPNPNYDVGVPGMNNLDCGLDTRPPA